MTGISQPSVSPAGITDDSRKSISVSTAAATSSSAGVMTPPDGPGAIPNHAAADDDDDDDDDPNTLSQTVVLAAHQAVAPFLSKHIPAQYVPPLQDPKANSKFCYRHRPDVKCRRQADEVTMQLLQDELTTLPGNDQQGIAHVWTLFSAAPAQHRMLMLKGIMAQCCYPQLSMIASSVKELIKIDFISVLPTELAFKILCYLDTFSLCRAAQVCRRWRQLADDDIVWQHMCEQHIDRKCTKCGWGLPLLEQRRLRSARRQLHMQSQKLALVPGKAKASVENCNRIRSLLASYSGDGKQKRLLVLDGEADFPDGSKRSCRTQRSDDLLADPAGPGSTTTAGTTEEPRRRPWKDVYRDRFKIGSNWKNGRYQLKTLDGHENGVLCVQVHGNTIATGSYDTTVKIWDATSGELIRTLSGHTSGVRCLQFDDSVLISGGMDKKICVWNWRTGKVVRTLQGHDAGVISVHFVQNYIASGSADHTIRVWDTDRQVTFVLRGHQDWVNCVRVDAKSRTLLSASDDMTVRLWDMDSRKCIGVLRGHVGHVQQVLPLPAESLEDQEAIATIIATGGNDADSVVSSGSGPSVSPVLPVSPDQSSVGGQSPSARWEWKDELVQDRPNPPRYILTASLDSTIYLWDTYAGIPVKKYFGHLEGVWGLVADTLRMVSGSQDGSVKVWDLHSGKCQRTYSLHEGPVTSVSLSDDRIVSGGQDGLVHVMEFGIVDSSFI